jgi:hypothetical protein
MSDYITKFTMKHEFNMTDALIKQLGEPDKVVKNPHYSTAAPMQLYLRERVAKWVEEHPDLIQKVVERRQKKPLKPPAPLPEPPEIVFVPSYRTSIRLVGDKWSWSVYQSAKSRVLKTGWADTKAQAEKFCDNVIEQARLLEDLDLEDYGFV